MEPWASLEKCQLRLPGLRPTAPTLSRPAEENYAAEDPAIMKSVQGGSDWTMHDCNVRGTCGQLGVMLEQALQAKFRKEKPKFREVSSEIMCLSSSQEFRQGPCFERPFTGALQNPL